MAYSMTVDHDLLANCQVGMRYWTRDRREARVDRVSADERLIFGQVQMHGPCVWRVDGRYRDAPFGAPGPLDLMPPGGNDAAVAGPRIVSMKEALEDDSRLLCCD
jgi:hypothetical protein